MAFAVEVGSFTSPASTTGTQDIPITTMNLVGLDGIAVMFWQTGSGAASGTWASHTIQGWGAAAINVGGGLTQYAVGTAADDAAATSNTARGMAAACITCSQDVGAGPAVVEQASFVDFRNGSGSTCDMRINWTVKGTGSRTVNFMVISGLTGAKVVNWTEKLTTGNKAVTGVGFQPDLVLHATMLDQTALPTSTAAAKFGFGAMNSAGEQWCNGFLSIDGAADSDTQRFQLTNACIGTCNNTPAMDGQAAYVSMDSDGFTVNHSIVSTVATNYFSLCLKGISSKIGSFNLSTSTGNQTITPNQGFTPAGILTTGFGTASSSTPLSQGRWNLGATDTTHSRLAMLTDEDAQATMSVHSQWRNDAFGGAGFGTTLSDRFSYVSSTSSTFVINVDATDAGGRENLYLLVAGANSAIGDTLQCVWNVSTSIGDTNQLAWNVSTAVGDTNQLVWSVLQAVGDPLQLIWNLGGYVGDTLGLQWNVSSAVADSVQLPWNVSTPLGKTNDLLWAVRQAIGDTAVLQWTVAQAVADSIALQWVIQRSLGQRLRLTVQHRSAVDLTVEVN